MYNWKESQYCLESSSYVQGSPVNAYCGLFYLIFTKFYEIDTVTTSSFFRWERWGTERLSHLSKATELKEIRNILI